MTATTASVQDLYSFIRFQKEKLSRERQQSTYGYLNVIWNVYMRIIIFWFNCILILFLKTPNINYDYQRQLDRYLHLPRTLSNDTRLYQIQQQQQQQHQQQPIHYPVIEPAPQFEQQQQQFSRQQTPPPPQQQQHQLNQQQIYQLRPSEMIRPAQYSKAQEQFIDKFGANEAIRNKLKTERQNEYREFLQQVCETLLFLFYFGSKFLLINFFINKKQKLKKNANEYLKQQQKRSQQYSNADYYATLPLRGMESANVIIYYFLLLLLLLSLLF